MSQCPQCGGPPALMQIAPRQDADFPGHALCECKSCQHEWSMLLSAEDLLVLAKASRIPIDWSQEWLPAATVATRAGSAPACGR